jgi:DNA polymerase-3 subunit epsilon
VAVVDFYAIDVETAGYDVASICQIGIAGYKNKKIDYEWESLIKPDEYFFFSQFNIGIHGITKEMVKNAPSLTNVYQEIKNMLCDNIVVCHTYFDRASLSQALGYYDLEPINCTWLDSARVARRTWKQFSRKGYGLRNICDFLGYEFKHHNALEDAKAAGQIILSAMDKSGININAWL